MISRVDRGLLVAVLATGGLVVAAIATRLARPVGPGEDAATALPLLLAIASLLSAALAAGRVPGLGWPLTIAAAILAVREPVALNATMQGSGGGPETWLPAAFLVGCTSTTAVAVAALYATASAGASRLDRTVCWAFVAWQAIATGASIALGLAGRPDDPSASQPIHVVTAPVAYWPILPLGLAVVGAAAGLRDPVRRAMAGRDRPIGPGALPEVAGALGDELLGRAASRRATEQRERARLAAELHADILPALRAAAADLDAGRDPAAVRTRLATIAQDVQALSLERRDLILEELGLVAALEAMAERTEERLGIAVEIDVDEPPGPAPTLAAPPAAGVPSARPPLAVERAALRVAELAVGNAARHGEGPVRLRVTAGMGMRLVVANDGPAYDPEVARAAVRRGARGLTEMREAAAEVDAALEIGAGPHGGAFVRFTWPRS